jgi:UDP-glucose 4-epimerase
LVTGASGFLGANLAQHLAGRADLRLRLQVATRPPPAALAGRAEVVRGSLLNRADLAAWARGADLIVHAAADTDVKRAVEDPLRSLDLNCRATMQLLDEARAAGVGRFVYINSARIYGKTQYLPIDEEHPFYVEDPYGASKLAGGLYTDLYHRLYKMPTVNLVVFSVYGPGQRPQGNTGVAAIFCRRVVEGQDITIYGDGSFQRDLLHITDFCRAVELALDAPQAAGRRYNLGTGHGVTIRDLAELCLRAGKELGFTGARLKYADALPGDVSNCADTRRITADLGFQPATRLEDGIREYIAWYAKHRDA